MAQPNLQETDAEKLKPASDHSHRKPQANQSANAPMHEEHIVAETAAGFNGRCNKVADTCYAFWVGASLAVRFSSLWTLMRSALILNLE